MNITDKKLTEEDIEARAERNFEFPQTGLEAILSLFIIILFIGGIAIPNILHETDFSMGIFAACFIIALFLTIILIVNHLIRKNRYIKNILNIYKQGDSK